MKTFENKSALIVGASRGLGNSSGIIGTRYESCRYCSQGKKDTTSRSR